MKNEVKDLVRRFISGDREAFNALVRRYEKKVYALAFHIMGNHLDADEVTQEAFVRIYNRREFIKNVDYFSSFLMRIATNYAIDLIRHRQKGFISVDSEPGPTTEINIELSERIDRPDELFEKAEIYWEIRKAIDRLPPRQRLTIIMHDIEGYSKLEIARALECPQATVRSNLHIARSKLRKWLDKIL